MPACSPKEPTGVAVIPDDIADAWEAAKAAHEEARKAVRSSDARMRAYLGNAAIGVRENGKAVCQRVITRTGGVRVPVKYRDDLRVVKEGAGNGTGK